MTAKSALILTLLEGRVLNIKNCVRLVGFTNCPREIGRMIERPFGVVVSRTPRTGKNRWGSNVTWYDYRLNQSEHNLEGIERMKTFVKTEQLKSKEAPTGEALRVYQQLGLF